MNKMYHMTIGGGLKEAIPVDELPIGTEVISIAPGYDLIYCVAGKRDERGQQKIVVVSEYFEDSYFSPISSVDKYIRPLSQKFGIGFYYNDTTNKIYTEKQVVEFTEKAEEAEASIKRKAMEKVEQDKKEIAELPSLFPHLKPIGEHSSYKELRANIIADLNKSFPNQKFSIKKRHYGSIDVRWTDGVSLQGVKDVIHKYKDHKRDFTGDYLDYAPSNFNKVFGGIEYIFEEREMSEEIKEMVHVLEDLLPNQDRQVHSTILRKVFNKTSFPHNATNIRLIRNENVCGFTEDFFSFEYDLSETETNADAPYISDLKIVDYSEKSFAVYGNTFPIKDKLFDLGGRFNRNLKDGAGFIFSKKNKDLVEAYISEINEY